MVETEPNKMKMSLRTRDAEKYDVSKIAAELGGGGHKGAAATVIERPLLEAKEMVLGSSCTAQHDFFGGVGKTIRGNQLKL